MKVAANEAAAEKCRQPFVVYVAATTPAAPAPPPPLPLPPRHAVRCLRHVVAGARRPSRWPRHRFLLPPLIDHVTPPDRRGRRGALIDDAAT